MTYNLNQAIAEAAAYAIDPDRTKYPHLFKQYRFTLEEIERHQASHKDKAPILEHPFQYLGQLAKTVPKYIKLDEPQYVPVSGICKVVPKSRLKQAGWRVARGSKPVTYIEPDTWIDRDSGEIFDKVHARKEGIRLPLAKSISDRMLDTIARIKACSPKERGFVAYVLKMRNRRGGLILDLTSVIDLWISYAYPDLSKSHKARQRKRFASILEKRRIMINTQTLASDLQILSNPTKQEIIEESARVYEVLKPAGRPGMGALANPLLCQYIRPEH